MLIDDGVDYYGFLRSLRENGTLAENEGKSLLEIMQYMGEMHEFVLKSKRIDFSRMRSRSLANLAQTQKVELEENNPLTPLKRLITDMAYEEDDLIDFASLKTALKSINCRPKDADLIFLIDYLAEEDEEDLDDKLVDLQYFFQFLHEAAINKRLWKNLTRLIESVANQLRRAERAERRRKDQVLFLFCFVLY